MMENVHTLFGPILMTFEFSQYIFEKFSILKKEQISNFF